MIYLLGQILLCLLLAAIAGWFIGWSWRGFREADRVEDLRRTLRATEEVKDRELAECQRRADALESRVETLQRRSEKLADELSSLRNGEASGGDTRGFALAARLDDDRNGGSSALAHPEEEILSRSVSESPADPDGENGRMLPATDPPPTIRPMRSAEALAGEGRAEEVTAETASPPPPIASDEALEEALAAKTAAVLELQAEIASLRKGAEERAGTIARLESRMVELEPMEERLRERGEEVERLRRELEEAREGLQGDETRADRLDERSRDLEAAILERDRRINELRQRYQDTAARLEVAEADQQALRGRLDERMKEERRRDARGPESAANGDRRLREVQETLQRQIDRNRKQEAVHQQVVANLRAELRDAAPADEPVPGPREPETDARVRQLIAERDARIVSLLRRVEQLESAGNSEPARPDDLRKIRGIGPKIEKRLNALGITRFAQIAGWTPDDVERFGQQLGSFGKRIVWDDWVERARRQHILRYGHPPEEDEPGQGS